MNQLPGYISTATLVATTGLSRSTIWRMTRRGEFPSPVSLSPGRVGYRRDEVEAWLRSREPARAAA